MSDLYRFLMMILHGGVAGLHAIELAHINALTITVVISIAFALISTCECIHLYHTKNKQQRNDHV